MAFQSLSCQSGIGVEVQNQDLQQFIWQFCPSLITLYLYFSPWNTEQPLNSSVEVALLYDLIIFKEVYSFHFYKAFVFEFPSPLASIRMEKTMHPAGAHCYNFSALLSTAVSIESRAVAASWPMFMEVTVSVRRDLQNTPCHETHRSLWISWWENSVTASNHAVNSWHSGTKGEKETQRPSSGHVTYGCPQCPTPGNTVAVCLPLALSWNALSRAVFASLLSCHVTVLSFLIPVKELALLRFPQEMEQT